MDSGQAATAHTGTAAAVVAGLKTDAGQGLNSAEAARRQAEFGPNHLPAPRRENPLKLLAAQFTSLLVVLLLIAAVISFITWIAQRDEALPYDSLVIMAIVVLNALLGFFQEFRAEKSLEKLRQLSGPEATALRDGSRRRLPATGLVPGDIIMLAAGDRIAADARLIKAASLEIDESLLTGESSTVLKGTEPVDLDAPLADRTGMVYSGTSVSHGRGVAVVTATGGATEVGKIAKLIEAAPQRRTPLQESLSQMARRLGAVIVLIAVAVSATGLFIAGPLSWDNAVNMLLFGVALAVFAIPEGLPAVMTGTLALGTQRMARRKAIIRKLPAIETLGCTSAICSDKTGTLTMGEMTVREVLVPSGRLAFQGAGYNPDERASGGPEALAEAAALAKSAVLCNDASIHEEGGRWLPVGSPTEAALVALALKLEIDYLRLREEHRRLAEEPFSSERKKMSVLVAGGEVNPGGGMNAGNPGGDYGEAECAADGATLHMKGAPEMVLPLCSRIATASGESELTEDSRRELLEAAAGMASRALRPLALARRSVAGTGAAGEGAAGATAAGEGVAGTGAAGGIAACESDLVFLGLAGLADPPRPEALPALEECRQAGIEVFMVTGDHEKTAAAIAAELGIRGDSMTGAEIEKTDDEELERLAAKVRVFARVSPGHKVRIVAALQRLGHTVAVTGDGVNDAPALKRADIGVAMGISGTDVAREAADMVLADDNFATIVAAVEEGRSIFSNIRKFVAYLLSSNAGGIVTLFAGVLFAGWLGLYEDGKLLLPLLVTQILWINLVSNGLPALALGVEPKEPEAMVKPPRPRSEPVINRRVWELITLVGVVAGLGTLFLLDSYFAGGFFNVFGGHSWEYSRTIAFLMMALFQLYNVFNCRRLDGSALPHLAGNRWLLGAVGASMAMMLAVIYVPLLQNTFGTEPLAASDWLVALAAGSAVIWAVEAFKALSPGGGSGREAA